MERVGVNDDRHHQAVDDEFEGEYDLTSCDREPIHILGSVQAFGVLIAVSADWIVSRTSANAEAFLGVSADKLVGQNLSTVMTPDALHTIRGLMQGLRQQETVERTFGLVLAAGGEPMDVAVHLSGREIVIEAEPAEAGSRDSGMVMRTMIGRLNAAQSIEEYTREACRQIRAFTGFDRVMAYRFEQDGSGEVVAETVRSGMEPFLGIRYPASDIPKQARALYLRNWLRMIHDVHDDGVPIVPPRAVTGEPLDLSMGVLRAVSPIHLEYLRNMGVSASMSISIIVDGKLWGLFACHHNSPHRVGLERRTAIELFGQMFSWLLDARLRDADRKDEERARAIHDRLMGAIVERGSVMDAVASQLGRLGELVACDGIGVWIDGEARFEGATVTPEEFTGLVRFLNRAPAGTPFATNELSSLHPPAADYAERSAGILAVPISRQPRDYLVFFRREIARSVTWAGNPNKPVTVGPNGVRLTPRKSFEAWRETKRGQCAPWTTTELRIADTVRATLIEIILRVTDAAAQERASANERQELLIAELNHRVRNILGLIRGLVAQTKSGVESTEDFAAVIGGRIQALARAHDQITVKSWGPGALLDLLTAEFDAYIEDSADRVRLEGPDALLEPQAFSTVALVIHEMVTNAAKYGGLKEKVGRVEVRWSFDMDDRLVIRWAEQGGPAVQVPQRRGFGSTIIERSIPYELKGEAELQYALAGVKARFVVPAAYVTLANTKQTAPGTEPGERAEGRLTGEALLVEDNMLIALDGEDMLTELGAERVETASTAKAALSYLETATPTFALLDLNLGDGTSIPVAERLRALGVPFIFATGYGSDSRLPPELDGASIVAKPYTAQMISRALKGGGR